MEIDGRTVRFSNPDKPLWPAFTKADLARYFVAAAPVLLDHVAGYPLTLHRFPDGVGGAHWYETRCPPRPPWVRVQRMHTFRRSGKIVDACVVDDIAGLVWAAQVAAVELHPFLGPADDLDHPRTMVIDLDPGPPAGVQEACAAAMDVRAITDAAGLRSYPKHSGVKGVHVHVPLAPGHRFEDAKTFARALAGVLVTDHPERYVDRMSRSLRRGKVFVDWSQNDAGKSTVAPYSLRGVPRGPTVAVPLTWDEVADCAAGATLLPVAPGEVLDRVSRLGDVMEGALQHDQRLPR